jgi:hypothetical protein
MLERSTTSSCSNCVDHSTASRLSLILPSFLFQFSRLPYDSSLMHVHQAQRRSAANQRRKSTQVRAFLRAGRSYLHCRTHPSSIFMKHFWEVDQYVDLKRETDRQGRIETDTVGQREIEIEGGGQVKRQRDRESPFPLSFPSRPGVIHIYTRMGHVNQDGSCQHGSAECWPSWSCHGRCLANNSRSHARMRARTPTPTHIARPVYRVDLGVKPLGADHPRGVAPRAESDFWNVSAKCDGSPPARRDHPSGAQGHPGPPHI